MSGAGHGRVAVVAGGHSGEREVSLKSGAAVCEALQRQGVDARLLDLDALIDALPTAQIDRVFIALHGGVGEDGTLQGALDLQNIPYTGSGVRASAICMHKPTSKAVWRAAGLPTPDWTYPVADAAALAPLGLPLAVKPAAEGSSLGISKVEAPEQVAAALHAAGGSAMAERWIEGQELTVAIVGGVALPPVRIEPARPFYDYDAKYRPSGTRYHCPSGLSDRVNQAVTELALAASVAVGMSGWGRVDLIRDAAGGLHLVEANTVPGLTPRSLVPMAAAGAGWSFDELVMKILDSTAQVRLNTGGCGNG